jgi:hypothetical protein
MTSWLKKALTRKITRKGSRGKEQIIVIPPSERLVYGVKFAMVMTVCLSAVEIAHITFLGTWNSEVFTVISGLIGNITGIFLTQKA